MQGRYLVISDLQIPYEHPKALAFCQYLKAHFKIEDDNVYCVGDELDQYWGGMWKKNINGGHTALQELNESAEKLKPWYDAFPKMKVCISNHGTRWQRKALEADIPQILMRKFEDVIKAPDLWVWQKHWIVKAKHPFMIEHGDDWGGTHPHVKAAEANNMSTIMGHHHSKAGVQYSRTFENHQGGFGYQLWGMVAGCLIDYKAYAFDYARAHRQKPLIGTGVVLDDGKLPIWIPI